MAEEAVFAFLTRMTGTALWAAQTARARHITPAPPILTACDQRRKNLAATINYNGNGCQLDIWRPRQRYRPKFSPAPVFVFLPGGAWVVGHRRPQGYALMSDLVERGWICVSVDYSTAPLHRWPKPFLDIQHALQWVKANITQYGGDPNFIAVGGASAGGHMAALAGLAWDDPAFSPTLRPDAVVTLYGVYDLVDRHNLFQAVFGVFLEHVVVGKSRARHPEVFEMASPIKHVRKDAPPFLVVQGKADWLTPASGAKHFCEELSAVSDCQYYEVPHLHAGHAFDLSHSPATELAIDEIGSFLEHSRKQATAKGAWIS